MTTVAADAFDAERPRLTRLAYRMLGSTAEAEDVVQDAWLRWRRAKGDSGAESVVDPAAWLTRVATRLCLDRLRADKAARAAYRGPWLPEPLIEDLAEDPLERAEEVSVAFLLALERLSPLERAVFLLHDVFDADYAAVAETLDRSEAACRQLAARARAHVREAKPRYAVSQEEAARLAVAFMAAAQAGDYDTLGTLLAEDAVMITDGGGKQKAALRPLVGREDVLALIKGLAWRGGGWGGIEGVRLARINGYLGAIVDAPDALRTIAFEPDGQGHIAAIYIVANPEKLRGLRAGYAAAGRHWRRPWQADPVSDLFRLSGAQRRDPDVEAWFAAPNHELRRWAKPWFERIRGCGEDVTELLHDRYPVALVQGAAFAYVNAFTAHANVGFFHGAMLPDPAGLLEGTGKRMRHVKVRWGEAVNEAALSELIAAAYRDNHARLTAEAG